MNTLVRLILIFLIPVFVISCGGGGGGKKEEVSETETSSVSETIPNNGGISESEVVVTPLVSTPTVVSQPLVDSTTTGSEPLPVVVLPVVLLVPLPVVLPPPIPASIDCSSFGVPISLNTEGFVSVQEECSVGGATLVDITVAVKGVDSGKVLEMMLVDESCGVWESRESSRGLVVDGKVKLFYTNPRGCSSGKSIFSLKARFSALDQLGVSETSRDITFNVMLGSDIVTKSPAVFQNTFPFKIGFARMQKGNQFYPKNSEIFRYNMETGVETAITYLGSNSYTINESIFVSPDGKRIMFSKNVIYIMDTDGAGCTSEDFVVVSAGCNKGMSIPLKNAGPNGFSTDGSMFGYTTSVLVSPGGPYRSDVHVARINPFGVERITTDEYGGTSPLVSKTGVYFYSCRPNCGIFFTNIDASTGKPIGVVKLIYENITGGTPTYVLSSFSEDGGSILFHINVNPLQVFSIKTDGTGLRLLGQGDSAQPMSDGRVWWVFGYKSAVIADKNGSKIKVKAAFSRL